MTTTSTHLCGAEATRPIFHLGCFGLIGPVKNCCKKLLCLTFNAIHGDAGLQLAGSDDRSRHGGSQASIQFK